jgi:hypothetical protein
MGPAEHLQRTSVVALTTKFNTAIDQPVCLNLSR